MLLNCCCTFSRSSFAILTIHSDNEEILTLIEEHLSVQNEPERIVWVCRSICELVAIRLWPDRGISDSETTPVDTARIHCHPRIVAGQRSNKRTRSRPNASP